MGSWAWHLDMRTDVHVPPLWEDGHAAWTCALTCTCPCACVCPRIRTCAADAQHAHARARPHELRKRRGRLRGVPRLPMMCAAHAVHVRACIGQDLYAHLIGFLRLLRQARQQQPAHTSLHAHRRNPARRRLRGPHRRAQTVGKKRCADRGGAAVPWGSSAPLSSSSGC